MRTVPVASPYAGTRPAGERGKSDTRGAFSLLPYLSIGLAVCLLAQLVFWFRLGDVGMLVWPFVWAYSQAAMLEVMLDGAARGIYGLVWAVGYLVLSVLLWLAFEHSRIDHRRIWLRSLLAWFSAEVALALLAWLLFTQDVIRME